MAYRPYEIEAFEQLFLEGVSRIEHDSIYETFDHTGLRNHFFKNARKELIFCIKKFDSFGVDEFEYLDKFIESPINNYSFVSKIIDFQDDNIAKRYLNSLFHYGYSYETEKHLQHLEYSDKRYGIVQGYKFKNHDIEEDGENACNLIPSYSQFMDEIVNFSDFKKRIKFIFEQNATSEITIKLNKFKRQEIPREIIVIGHRITSLNVKAIDGKIETNPNNDYEIDSFLRNKGFPYGESEDEYVRYLNDHNKYYRMVYSKIAEDTFFRNKKELREIKFPASRIVKLLWKAPIDKADFINHTYVVARSGSGKSEFLKTLIVEMGGSCILLDPHGDFSDSLDGKKGFFKVAPHQKRFVINPFDITDKTRENRELVGQEITNLIRELIAESGLSSLMDTVVKPVIQTLLKLEYADFAMLTDCFNPVGGVEKLEALTPHVDDTIRNWEAIKGDQYETTKKSIFNRLVSFLNNGTIRDTVCGLDDFEEAIGRVVAGENLVLSVPSPTIGDDVSQVLGRFFMCRMQVWAKRRQNIPESQRTPVFLIVDECQNFLSEVTAKTLDQFGRKFGLFMVLAHQHVKQIENTALKDSILTNCKNKIVGQASKATRQALSGEMGLDQSDFEGLGRGYYWGTFENKGTIKFYSRMVKIESTGQGTQYATSQNTAYVDGWQLVQGELSKPTQTHAKTQETPRKYKPKFDL